MISLKARTNGAFGKAIRQRIEQWDGVSRSSAGIEISKALYWWKFQEYGVKPSQYSEKTDPLGILPGTAYIWRRGQGNPSEWSEGAGALYFKGTNGFVLTMRITHAPGLKAREMVTSVIPDVRAAIHKLFVEIHKELPDNPGLLRGLVLESTLTAREMIRQSFADRLSDTPREGGRLKDLTAAQQFEQESRIVDRTE